MRKILFAAAVVFLIWSVAYPQQNPKVEPLSVWDLRRPVIGEIGIPLGKVTEIEATIINGDQLHQRRFAYEYILQVNKVDGEKLKAKPIMEFRCRSGVDLPGDVLQLKESKTGKKAGQVTRKEAEELEKGYVGTTVKLVAYESGQFDGIPDLPKGIPVWQDHGFGFSSYLVVLAKRK